MTESPAPTPPSAPAPAPPPGPDWQRTALRILFLIGAVALVFYIAGHWARWVGARDWQSTDDAYLQTDITPLGAKVSGYVSEAPVGDFQSVHQGDLLVSLVPDDYRAQLALQEADLAAASAAVATNEAQAELQRANIRAAAAAIDGAAATLSRNHREAVRQRRLETEGSGTEQARETADANDLLSEAQLRQYRAQMSAAEQQLTVLAAQHEQAEAALAAARANRDQAQLNLKYTRIAAPTDGVTGLRQVRVGQYISSGQQVAVLAALPRIWVIANFKETQIGRMRTGQRATLAIDSFPGRALSGHVTGFSPGSGAAFALLPPDNATGNFTKVVQRVAVKIEIDDAGDLAELLRPGLSVVASVQVHP